MCVKIYQHPDNGLDIYIKHCDLYRECAWFVLRNALFLMLCFFLCRIPHLLSMNHSTGEMTRQFLLQLVSYIILYVHASMGNS